MSAIIRNFLSHLYTEHIECGPGPIQAVGVWKVDSGTRYQRARSLVWVVTMSTSISHDLIIMTLTI